MAKKEKDYIDKVMEQQDHQFDPYYYTGGNLPLEVTDPAKPKLLAIVSCFIPGALSLFVGILFLFLGLDNGEFDEFFIAPLLLFLLSIFSFWIGFRYIKKDKIIRAQIKKLRKKHKN